MVTFRCETPGCMKPPLLENYNAECPMCRSRFCGYHYEDTATHACWPYMSGHGNELKPSMDETNKMFSTLDMDKILQEACIVREGSHTCTGPPQPFKDMREDPNIKWGGIHGHFKITFDDGVEWMVRMRQRKKAVRMNPEFTKMDMENDAATCVTLHQNGVKVPMAWLRPNDIQNPDDLLYFFMEHVTGKSYKGFWTLLEPEPDDKLRRRILEVAKFYISLERITFPKVGSPSFQPDGTTTVGPRTESHPYFAQHPWALGPFDTPKQYYLSATERHLAGALDGTMFRPSNTIAAYLIALEARELILGCKELEEGPWYLGHGEPRGDHFLFGKHDELIGAVDWEGSYISCKADALRPPPWREHYDWWFGRNDPLGIREQLLVEAYIKLGRPDFAELIPRSRKFARLDQQLGAWNYEPKNLNAFRRAFLGLPDNIEGEPKTWRERMLWAIDRFKDDSGLQVLLQRYEWDTEKFYKSLGLGDEEEEK